MASQDVAIGFSSSRQSLEEVLGINIPSGVPIRLFSETFDAPLTPIGDGGIVDIVTGSYAYNFGLALDLVIDRATLGTFEVSYPTLAELFTPDFISAGQTFSISTSSLVDVTGAQISGDSISLGNVGLDLTVSSTGARIEDLGFLQVAGLFDDPEPAIDPGLGTITFDPFNVKVDLVDFNLSVGTSDELIDGVNVSIESPGGESRSGDLVNATAVTVLPTASVEIEEPLALISVNPLELGGIPALKPLDVLTEDFGPYAFSIAGVDFSLTAEYTLLAPFIAAGFGIVQSFEFIPSQIEKSVTIAGETITGVLGDSFDFTAPADLVGPLAGSVTYDLDGAVVVSYRLAPIGSIGVEALGASFELTEDGDTVSLGFGPVFEASASGSTDFASLEIFRSAPIDLPDDFFAPITQEFAIGAQRGQDLAFVIDTTGSMSDDIAAVRASANSIINAVFDESRGLADSRIAIVGYNDPFTETILSFTNQENIADRKAAATSAINGINVSGGGDEPELTYAGLLRALNGGAGEWRPDAVSRKIVLFGDASPKDTELRPQVFALAADLGVDISGLSVASLDLPEELSATGTEVSVTTLSLAPAAFSATEAAPLAAPAPVSVQIFTIVLGGSFNAAADFELIAEETGGTAFSAAGASEIVDAILEVLSLPIYGIAFSGPTLAEGSGTNTEVTVTVTRDVADDAAQVTLVAGGTADTEDYLGTIPATISFAEGEFTRSFTLTIIGDTRFEGDETLTVSISAVDEPASITAPTAQLTILDDDAANSAPVARNDLVEVMGAAPLVIAPLANDSDADDDVLELVAAVGEPGKGTIVLNDDETLTYTSSTGETAIDLIDYTITDGAETASAQVLVRVIGTFAEDIVGDEGDDVLAAGEGSDRIGGGLGSDFLAGVGGGDILLGGEGNDYLLGGAGDDTIIGGAGKDTMYGGKGTNIFVFGEGDLGAAIGITDEITAFGVLGTDFLDFSGIDAIAGDEDDAFTFIGEAAFSGTAGELRFERSGGNTDIFGDTDGDGLADIALRLYGNIVLDESALIA